MEQNKRFGLMEVIATILVVVLVVLLAYIVFLASIGKIKTHVKSGILYTEGVENEDKTSYISIKGYSELHFSTENEQEFSFNNPKENDCYMDIELLTKGGASIFRVNGIEPGYGIESVETGGLDVGVYDCEFRVQCYSMEDGSKRNEAVMDLTLYVG